MASIFHAKSTTDEVLDGHDLTGKRALVTGVSAGLGIETARALVARGAHVIGTARDLAKADRASAPVKDAASAPGGGGFEIVEADLADLASVRRAADRLRQEGLPLDLVVANAGVMATPFGRTRDGFETQFGTNVLGHFVLVNRLAPQMREGARLVMLSSSGHRYADVDLDDPNFERTDYVPYIAYGRSKTGDALIAVAFDDRHKSRGVRAASVHPGGIRTELMRHSDDSFDDRVAEIDALLAAQGKPPFEFKTVPQGAATSVWAGIVAEAEAVGGRYCENCHVGHIVAEEDLTDPVSEGVFAYAQDPDRAEALWRKAEEMVGERF